MALPDAMSACSMCVEIMAGGTTWTDYSDFLTVIEPPTQTRMTAEQYVFGEDTAALGWGKREPVDVPVRGVFEEGTASPFYAVLQEWEAACGDMVAVRYSPGGCTTDNDSFRTSTTAGKMSTITYPGGDAASADVLMFEFSIRTPEITRAVWS